MRVLTLSLSLSLAASALQACAERPVVGIEAVATKSASSTQQKLGTLDESFLAITSSVPSFAGAYFSDDGALVKRLVDPADSSRAMSAMHALLLNRVRVDESKISESRKRELALPRQWRFERASNSFKELFESRAQLFLDAFQSDEVVSLDIDERLGRVVVGVLSNAAADRVRSKLKSDAARTFVAFEIENPAILARNPTLNFRRRPITGGYQLGPSACTTTIGARRGSEELIITNSHCSAAAWGLDIGQIRQNNSGNAPYFGSEVTDPPTYACGTLFVPRRCRRADVTAYSAFGVDLFPDDTLGWAPGLIARTTFGVAGVTQTSGSTDIDAADPHWNVIAEINFPLQGEAVHKVGITTGWTFGGVYETCKDVRADSHGRPLIVCSDKAHLNIESGDSGSPIFAMYGGYPNTVAFYGVGFAQDGGSSGIFSNFGQMKQDLGNIWVF